MTIGYAWFYNFPGANDFGYRIIEVNQYSEGMELHKYLFMAALVALTLIIVACTTEVEVVKEVEVTREVPVAAAPVDVPLPMLGDPNGKMYVLQEDKSAVLSGSKDPVPLVLHINVGDCVNLLLSNETAGGPVSVHADMLAYDPNEAMGIAAGTNPPQTVPPGGTRMYTFFAHPEVGETVAMLRVWGNVLENPGLGLYGAIVVGPSGATYTHPVTGEDMSQKSGWRVDVHPPSQASYRDFTLFIQDQDEALAPISCPTLKRWRACWG